jgi:hypothetical protein
LFQFPLAPEILTKVTDVTVKKCFPHQSVLEGLMLDVLPDTLDSFSFADTFLVGEEPEPFLAPFPAQRPSQST